MPGRGGLILLNEYPFPGFFDATKLRLGTAKEGQWSDYRINWCVGYGPILVQRHDGIAFTSAHLSVSSGGPHLKTVPTN